MKDLYEYDDIIYELNGMQDGPPLDPLRKAAARRVYMAQAGLIAKNKFQAGSAGRKGFLSSPILRFALRVVMVLLLAFSSLFAGTVYAAEVSIPGDLMYPLNLRIEDTRLALAASPERAIGLSLAFSGERLSEIRQLISIGRYEYIPSTLALYRQIISSPVLAEAKNDPALAESSVRIIETLTEQEGELRSLRAGVMGVSQDEFDQALVVLNVERQQHVMALTVSGYDGWPGQTDEGESPGDSGQNDSMPAEFGPGDEQETFWPDFSSWLDDDDSADESGPGQGNPTPPGLNNPGQGNPTPPGLNNPGQGNPTPPGLNNPGQGSPNPPGQANPTPPGQGKDKDKDKGK